EGRRLQRKRVQETRPHPALALATSSPRAFAHALFPAERRPDAIVSLDGWSGAGDTGSRVTPRATLVTPAARAPQTGARPVPPAPRRLDGLADRRCHHRADRCRCGHNLASTARAGLAWRLRRQRDMGYRIRVG